MDIESEKTRLEEEIKYEEGFMKSVEAKLSNERFVAGAPPQVIEVERKKLADSQSKIAALKENYAKLAN